MDSLLNNLRYLDRKSFFYLNDFARHHYFWRQFFYFFAEYGIILIILCLIYLVYKHRINAFFAATLSMIVSTFVSFAIYLFLQRPRPYVTYAEVNKFARESLRRKLKELGFGMLQDSVWVTPHDISRDMREFLESKKLGAYAFVLEVSGFLAGDRGLLIERIWKLRSLNEKYNELLTEVKKLNEMYVAYSGRYIEPTTRGKNFKDEILKLRGKYLQVLLIDPCLPKELLPNDWAGEKARKAIRNLK